MALPSCDKINKKIASMIEFVMNNNYKYLPRLSWTCDSLKDPEQRNITK